MREKGFVQAIKKIELVEKKVSRQICKFALMKFQIVGLCYIFLLFNTT